MTDSNVFIDTAPFIYALEDNEFFSAKVRNALSKFYLKDTVMYTSLLTFTEYCVMPYRKNETRKIEDFEQFILDANISVLPLTKSIAKFAAQIRAKYSGIKAMDALQLATAISRKCDVFLTNDKQLHQIEEIKVLLVDEL